MPGDITLRKMEEKDIQLLDQSFLEQGHHKEKGYFAKCFRETLAGERVTLLAFVKDNLAGCCHLIMEPNYDFYREHGIPEINDLNVFEAYRRKGIASLLIDEFENIASENHDEIGIGVGLYKDYGPAQRLYFKKGYIPDGRGVQYKDKTVPPGATVRLDDDLVLCFTKKL